MTASAPAVAAATATLSAAPARSELAGQHETDEPNGSPPHTASWAENASTELLETPPYVVSILGSLPSPSSTPSFTYEGIMDVDRKESFDYANTHDRPFDQRPPQNDHDRAVADKLTFGRLAQWNSDSPQARSSSNQTDGSQQSRLQDGLATYPSTHSSISSALHQDRAIKTEQMDSVQPTAIEPDSTHQINEMPETEAHPVKTESMTPSMAPSAKRRKIVKEVKLQVSDFKARTALPTNISHHELARQSIEAALASRLNPFVLHPAEFTLLKDHICALHVTAYLNIRNRILRLWFRNPLVAVNAEEAAGCAIGAKWLGLAEVAYEWLVRNGYINFGCLEIPGPEPAPRKRSRPRRKTVVVIGAGMAGLGCARQLEGLFSHYSDHWTSAGQEPPQVIVLEGRGRLGGRIYSHPMQHQMTKRIPKGARCTAELGAHIITGFDHGNPLNMIIRGQLALPYYSLKDNSSLYDIDGRVVDLDHDKMVEKLFNDMLERASLYRHKHPNAHTIEGDRSMIEAGKDPNGEAGKVISGIEAMEHTNVNQPTAVENHGVEPVFAGLDKLTGRAMLSATGRSKVPAAQAAQAMGWQLASPALAEKDIDLDSIANATSNPTLGEAMDEATKQYQTLLNLGPQDLRLINWHFANLEYANAANVGKLSLGGWDQDIGNEFEGEHAQVIGGYIQVPRGIYESPFPLDLRTRRTVSKIQYDPEMTGDRLTQVICSDGKAMEADHVVLTTPLGVLKHRSIAFEPALPSWKSASIEKLGFGVLNKVILVYERPFWDVDQDMIGLLRDTDQPESGRQDDYSTNRGRFYLFWNCIKTTGRPLLIALMAGDAAVQAETRSDGDIVVEVQQQLSKMFRHRSVPMPMETVVTRWGQDPFARGTYSYVGPSAHSDDYDAMAKPVGNLHFGGEATCGTHPATVHGAYISGLRAASEVIDAMLGPIAIPQPLIRVVAPKPEPTVQDFSRPAHTPQSKSRADESLTSGESPTAKQARLESFEGAILRVIFTKLGPRPDKPNKMGANPFLLFSKDTWTECKNKCDAARQATLGNPAAKASRNEIRAALGLMWREAPEEIKRPYLQQTVENKASNHENTAIFQARLQAWDAQAIELRQLYISEHPGVLSQREEDDMWAALGVYGHHSDRRMKKEPGGSRGGMVEGASAAETASAAADGSGDVSR